MTCINIRDLVPYIVLSQCNRITLLVNNNPCTLTGLLPDAGKVLTDRFGTVAIKNVVPVLRPLRQLDTLVIKDRIAREIFNELPEAKKEKWLIKHHFFTGDQSLIGKLIKEK